MDMENITDIYEIVNLGPCPCEVWVGIGKGCCGWKKVGGVGNKGEQNENEEIYSKTSHALYYSIYSCKIIYI